jgi:hypothetical protein
LKLGRFIILLWLAGSAYAQQQEAATFLPPRAHEAQRYEAGWNKNPFTLKTAPQVMESVSFAKDLTIGTYYGDAADPTIIIVNTKTNERIRLKQDQPAANGMKLSTVKFGTSRKDVIAEVTLGSETAPIRYNDSYVKQMAAGEMTKAPANQHQPGAQQRFQQPQTPAQPVNGAPPGTPPSTAQTASLPPGQTGFVAPGGARGGAPGGPPGGMAGGPRTALPQMSATGAQPGAAPLVSQAGSGDNAPPVPPRRRFFTPALNGAAISQ